MVSLPFPRSSTPGNLTGEGQGRLLNAYVEKSGDINYIRRVPGLSSIAVGGSGPRGMIEMDGFIYAACAGVVVAANLAGFSNVRSGTLPGTDGVTFAFNNRTTGGVYTRDLVAVRESGGAYIVTGAVAAYPDANLPATVNSVTFLDGYFLFTVPDGRIFASGLNNTSVNALSFVSAESKPDGLVRGVVVGSAFFAMGGETIEIWRDTGASPFPLQRQDTISIGLLTTMAVAGFEQGWGRELIFVAQDKTVRALNGYDPVVISTAAVERFISNSTTSTLEASVHTFRGHAMWTLSSDRGTWEFDLAEKSWHERVSLGLNRWRGSRSVKSGGKWIVGDTLSTSLLAIDETVRSEQSQPLTWTVESADFKEYPARVAIPSAFFDFTKASQNVTIQWSHDGGQTWNVGVVRALTTADKFPVRVNRLGLATHHGLRVRLVISDVADFSFLGGSVPNPEGRAP